MIYSPPNAQGFTGKADEYAIVERFIDKFALMLDD